MWWHTLVTQHSRGASRRILNARAYHEFAASLGYIVSSEGCGGVVGNSPVHVLCYCARTLKTGKDIYLWKRHLFDSLFQRLESQGQEAISNF